MAGKRQSAVPEALLLVLRAMGQVWSGLTTYPGRWLAAGTNCEPHSGACDGGVGRQGSPDGPLNLGITETSVSKRRDVFAFDRKRRYTNVRHSTEHSCWSGDQQEIGNVRYVARELAIGRPLPTGYHRLDLELGSKKHQVLLISAPIRACFPFRQKVWGVFAPIYSLHSRRNPTAGDFADFDILDRLDGRPWRARCRHAASSGVLSG